jgi:HKD family nuclease
LLYNQPLAVRFGTELLRHVDQMDQIDPFWDRLDIAVAWVRASGMAYIANSLANFLRLGGQLSIIVGIDLQNTTREGLQALLDLEQYGRAETFVYHNESGSVFHPKLYLFRNDEEARLIVGSNNITESGLYVNVEAGLQVDTDVNATVIAQALDAISSWKDTNTRLSARLDADFLARLARGGYVPDEATARAQLRQAHSRPRRSSPTVVRVEKLRTSGLRSKSTHSSCAGKNRNAASSPAPGCPNADGHSSLDAPEKSIRHRSSDTDADPVQGN